jgi:hypothetical protein
MPTLNAPVAALETAAHAAGLTLTSVEPGTDFAGTPTTRATVALAADASRTYTLELSEAFEASNAKFTQQLAVFFGEAAQRLRNPRPNCYLSLLGLPLSFGKFAWPFHGSTSGADTFIVHGEVRLEDGTESVLHAKISASMTQTFATVVAALEQPFAEGFIYNAVRKTLDQGQLELVKSGNRQPVPVTTRYYSMKQQVFVFNDTNEQQRHAQYLNTTVAELKATLVKLVAEGLVQVDGAGEWATATDALREQETAYRAEVAEALAFIKPTFNEDMRAGHTNM